jgi:hypothetical protein
VRPVHDRIETGVGHDRALSRWAAQRGNGRGGWTVRRSCSDRERNGFPFRPTEAKRFRYESGLGSSRNGAKLSGFIFSRARAKRPSDGVVG